MKVVKLYLLISLVLFILPVVNADINLDSFVLDKYNLGDSILVSGSVTHTNTTRANLNLVLNCNGNSAQVAAVLLDLRANQQIRFSRFVTLPTNLLGQCKIVANLADINGNAIEFEEFEAFELTDQLKGNFDINGDEFQLGDKVIIRGTIAKQNNVTVDGYFFVSFKQGGNTLFLDTVEISDGVVDYELLLSRIPTGNYTMDLSASDTFGNSKVFVGLFNFTVDGNLEIHTTFDRTLYSPGDTISLNGYISGKLNKPLKNINLEFNFGNEIRSRTLATGADTFNINHIIPTNIKTGDHNVSVIVSDEEGNYANEVFTYGVRAIPTVLSVNLESNNYDPEESVGFSVSLLDQAGDPMQDNVNLYLISEGEVISSKIVGAGLSDSILIPQYAPPGSWKIKVEGLGLEDEELFTVREYQKLDASVEGTELTVNNIGNVPFKGLLELRGNDLNKTKNVKLDVGDSSEINLAKLFPPGSYNLSLPNVGKSFENIIIPGSKSLFSGLGNPFGGKVTGNVAKNVDSPGRKWLLFAALIVACCGLIYLVFANRKGKNEKIDFKSDRGYMQGQKKLEELKAKGIRKDRPVEYGKATQADIDDWKKRVQKTFADQEKRKSENEFLNNQRKSMNQDKPKEGFFNMFG